MSNIDRGGLFEDEATRYDETIRLVDPFYEELHKMMLDLAVESIAPKTTRTASPAVALDIGSGTGAEAIHLLQQRELAHLSLIAVDTSHEMHAAFLQRAAKSNVPDSRFQLIQGDILQPPTHAKISTALREFGATRFKVALSAFTLHHFQKDQKAAVFRLVHESLEPGGLFLFGDLFNFEDESRWLTSTIFNFETRWFQKNFNEAAEKAEQNGDQAKAIAYRQLKQKWLRHYYEENYLDSVSNQLTMLRQAGFEAVGNPMRYWQVGLLVAQKKE